MGPRRWTGFGESGNFGSMIPFHWRVRQRQQGSAGFHQSMNALQRMARLWLCATVLAAAGVVARGQGLVAPPPDPPAQPAQPPGPTVTVRGMVINGATGAPLPRAQVMVYGNFRQGVLTDGEGRFELHGVLQGDHTFMVTKPGFGMNTGFDDNGQSLVHVGEQMPEQTFSLFPRNAIYGHVTLSSGLPAEGVTVELLRQVIQDGRAMWAEAGRHQSSPDGSFRFGGLHDGAYMVRSTPEFENEHGADISCGVDAPAAVTGYAPVFSSGSAEMNSAAQINVAAGQSTEVNVALTQTKFHRVRIAVARSAAGGWELTLTLYDGTGQAAEYPVREEKDQMCVYLPDGAYTLMAQAIRQDGPGRLNGLRKAGGGDLAGTLEFTVDAKPANLRVALTQAGTTPVHLRFVPGPPKPATNSGVAVIRGLGQENGDGGDRMSFTATRMNTVGIWVEGAHPVGETEYEIDSVPPGSYWISAGSQRQGECIGAVTAGGTDLGRTPWVARNTGTGMAIDVEIRTDCAKLTVALPTGVAGEDAGAPSVVFVYVVPDFDAVEGPSQAALLPFQRPSETLDDLTPGRYRVYAFRQQRLLEFRNPATFSRLGAGQEVTLEPNGTATLMLEDVQP